MQGVRSFASRKTSWLVYRVVQEWRSYWFTLRSKLEFNLRHLTVSHEFIPNRRDARTQESTRILGCVPIFNLSASVQYEAWIFPVISSTRQSDVTSSAQLFF